MAISEKVRNLDLRSTRVYTLSDKVKEKPVMLLTNTDLITNKKGNVRDIQLGRCYDFLGTNEYVEIPHSSDFDFATGTGSDFPFSVSAWIYMDDATNFPIICKNVTAGQWFFDVNTDILTFRMSDASVPAYMSKYISGMDAYEGEWIHVCGTYDGSETLGGINTYINGISQGTPSGGGAYQGIELNSDPVRIGEFVTTYANGKMFDVRLHSTEISASDVYRVMLGAPSRYEVGWWKCDEGAGVVSYDSSGREHHGLVKNATLSTFHVNDSGLPYSFQNNAGFNIGKLYNSSTTTSTTSTSTSSTSTTSTSSSTSTTSISTTSTSTSTTTTSTSTSTSTSTTSTTSTSSSTTTT